MSQEKDIVKVFGVPFPAQQKTGLLDAFKYNSDSEQTVHAVEYGIPSSEFDFATQVRDILASIKDFQNPEGMVIDAIERTEHNRGYTVVKNSQSFHFKPAKLDPRSQSAYLNTEHSMGEIIFNQNNTKSNLLENPATTESVHGTELTTANTSKLVLSSEISSHSEVTMRRLYRIGTNQVPEVNMPIQPELDVPDPIFFSPATDKPDSGQISKISDPHYPEEQTELSENLSQLPTTTPSPFLSSTGPIQIVRSDLDEAA